MMNQLYVLPYVSFTHVCETAFVTSGTCKMKTIFYTYPLQPRSRALPTPLSAPLKSQYITGLFKSLVRLGTLSLTPSFIMYYCCCCCSCLAFLTETCSRDSKLGTHLGEVHTRIFEKKIGST